MKTMRALFAFLLALSTVGAAGAETSFQERPVHKLAGIGVIVIGNSPAKFAASIKSELAVRPKLIKEVGLRAKEQRRRLLRDHQNRTPTR